MVSTASLFGIAAALLLVALLVARLRGLPIREASFDALAAGSASLILAALAAALYGWVGREAGSWALLATPVAATAALRARGPRSIPRALLAGIVALVVVIGWLTLNLKGVRGGWSAAEISQVLLAGSTAVAAAACLGWWSRAARPQR